MGFPGGASGKELAYQFKRQKKSGLNILESWEDPLEEVMATHSSLLALEIPRTEKPGSHKESCTTECLSIRWYLWVKM